MPKKKPLSKEQILKMFKFELRPHQEEAFDVFYKWVTTPKEKRKRPLIMILVWPRRAGKDIFTKKCEEITAALHPGEYYYFFPEAGQGIDNIFDGVRMDGTTFLDAMPREMIKVNKVRSQYTWFNGSVSRFRGTDKKQISRRRGFNAQGCFISEGAYHSNVIWEVVKPAISASRGICIVNSTVNGENWFWQMYLEHKDNPHSYTSFLTIDDLEWWGPYRKSDELIDEERREYIAAYGDDLRFRQEYYNDVSAGAFGAILHRHLVTARQEGRVGTIGYDNHYPVDTYWDLGADGTAIWFGQKIGNKRYLIDYEEVIQGDVREYVEVLANKPYRYGTHFLPHDAANQDGKQKGVTYQSLFKEQFRKLKINPTIRITPKALNESTTIMTVQNQFRNFVFDEDNCREGIRHLDLVHRSFDKEKKIYSQKVVHDEHSHGFQALAIAAYNMRAETYFGQETEQEGFAQYPKPQPINTGGVFDK